MNRKASPLTSVIMIPVALLVGLPLYYIVVNTFKTQGEMSTSPLALPQQLYLENYRTVFESVPLASSFTNTLYVTALSILLMLLIGSTAAYGMIMRNSVFNRWFGVALLLGFIIPGQSTLIPLYRLLVDIHLVNTLTGLVLLYSAGSIFCYFLIQGYMRTVPFEIIEAARIDGAGVFGIYWRIVLPLIRPILVTVGVFQTMWVWNDFITPNVFLSSPEKKTLVLQVYTAVGQFSTNWPSFMTLSVIVLIPMVVFFILTQRHIVNGLLAGGVKG
ncbi:carbohydrate ABC transporter permease [Occultella kanbiaonis]|uniref:carbohydrate ABC transporter permease n=1 Tax=Occultella kanbiaonis TaxID=2675754 RepID=UPI001E512CE1|nr:carbohydrate ABC transporter permease [Occultella kanbiaonis]